MTTIVLTPDPAHAAVDVVVTGAGGVVNLYRTDSDGAVSLVRGSPFATQGGALTVVDQEATFGRVSYSTDPKGSDAVSTVLDVDQPWLTHPVRPFLSVPVAIVDDDEWSYPGRTYVFDVIDRDEPVVTWYRRSSRQGTVQIAYRSTGERRAIRDALATGTPMLLRYPPGCDAFLSGWVAVFDARMTPLVPGSSQGSIALDYVAVSSPPADVAAVPGWSWADVPGQFATWADVVARVRTWSDLVTYRTVPKPRTTTLGA